MTTPLQVVFTQPSVLEGVIFVAASTVGLLAATTLFFKPASNNLKLIFFSVIVLPVFSSYINNPYPLVGPVCETEIKLCSVAEIRGIPFPVFLKTALTSGGQVFYLNFFINITIYFLALILFHRLFVFTKKDFGQR